MMETETRTADRAGTAAKETVRTETRAVTGRERIRTVRAMGREAGMVRAIAVLEALVVLARALGGLARIAAGLRAATAGRTISSESRQQGRDLRRRFLRRMRKSAATTEGRASRIATASPRRMRFMKRTAQQN